MKTERLAIIWQNIAWVWLQLKFAFLIRLQALKWDNRSHKSLAA